MVTPETRANAGDWRPLPAASRSTALDVLRGFALFGVLVANTLAFAYPLASMPREVPAWRGSAAGDVAAQVFMGFLVEGRFYLLLSALFGAGLMLQALRARRERRSFMAFAARRACVLFAIGLAHGAMLFAGDILVPYALIALLASPFTRLSPRALAASALLSALVGIAGLTVYAASYPERPLPQPPAWAALAAAPGTRSTLVVESGAALAALAGVSRVRYFETLAGEVRVARSGTWHEQVRLRLAVGLGYLLPSRLLLLGPLLLAFFLAGMTMVSLRAPADGTGAPEARLALGPEAMSRSSWICGTLVASGVLAIAAAEGVRRAMPESLAVTSAYWAGTFGGTALQATGYAAGILAFATRQPDRALTRGLAAVGRTALSNYVVQSLVLSMVFYRPGLGLMTQLTALPVVSLALPVFALQMWISVSYLRRYGTGPLEWVWRRASYGTLAHRG